MELKKTRTELVKIFNELTLLEFTGFKLCYAIARSLDKLQPEIKAIQAASKSLDPYNAARGESAQKHAAKDADDNPKRTDTGFIIGDLIGFNKDQAALDKKYARELADRDTFMNELVTTSVHAVGEVDIPEDITMAQMRALLPLIEQKE